MMLVCSKCNEAKALVEFPARTDCTFGRAKICQKCRNEWQRARRLLNGNSYTKKYEKTPKGFLMRIYRNMKSRVDGVQKAKAHLYAGKELLSREDFHEWADSTHEFRLMFAAYEESGFDRKLAPTVDRINSEVGYVQNNMQWLTHSANSAKANKRKYL